VTLIVKRATSITGELWAAFTAAVAASTLAEIAISRVRSAMQNGPGESRGRYSYQETLVT
jgi:hypothetical protein